MGRYERQEIVSGQQNWDDPMNENFENVFDKPFPPVAYASPANLPNASEYEDTLATAGGGLYFSDGTSWIPLSAVTGGLTKLTEVTLNGLNTRDIVYDSEWDVYNNIYIKLEDVIPSAAAKVGIALKKTNNSTYMNIRHSNATNGRYLTMSNTDLYSGAGGFKSSMTVRVSNRPTINKGAELYEAAMFDSSAHTMPVNARRNLEVLNSSWANISSNDNDCPVIESNTGGTVNDFYAFQVATEGGVVFSEGKLVIFGG